MISTLTIAALGGALGVAFGYIANKTNFCTMGGVADVVNMGSWTRMHMWLAALGVAVLATGGLQLAGLVDTTKSIYAGTQLRWLSHLVGGAVFGVGMVLAGGCANKQLLRLGGGNLRGLVVFMFVAFSAAVTMTGLFGVWRAKFLDPMSVAMLQGIQLPGAMGMNTATGWLIGMALFGVLPLAWAFSNKHFRKANPMLAGLGLGLLVAAGWYITGKIGFLPEHPETLEPAWVGTANNRPESLSYVAPMAQTLSYFTLFSDAKNFLSFGVASAWGVVLGAFLQAKQVKRFRWEVFANPTDFFRHVGGAMLMGFGGVTALGCTVGQGITGMSTLSLGSLLTVVGLIAGSAATVKWELSRA